MALLFLDMDMAILAAPPNEYRAYAAAVRAEFVPAVGRLRYRIGRRRFLRGLLASPHIYLTEWYRERMEERARANVREELAGRS
jgi:predicted metal-dependent HD superfamily phosphohydrolase